jgi:hypothetical protein
MLHSDVTATSPENPAPAEAAPAPIPQAGGRIARSYCELVDAIALRLVELGLTHLSLDEKCGLALGYTGKLLAPSPTRMFRARNPAAVLAERLRTREGRELLAEARREAARKGWVTRR